MLPIQMAKKKKQCERIHKAFACFQWDEETSVWCPNKSLETMLSDKN